MPGELLRQGLVGQPRFCEDKHAGSLLVEPVDDGEAGPARFAMPEPVINSFAGKRPGRVRVQARRFVDHEQMLVFEENQRLEHLGSRRGDQVRLHPASITKTPSGANCIEDLAQAQLIPETWGRMPTEPAGWKPALHPAPTLALISR